MALFENANYDFIKWRWHAIALSAIVIIAGFAYGFQRGIPLGIDFSGGTILVVKFEQPVSDDQVRRRDCLGDGRERHPDLRRPGAEPEADPHSAARCRRRRRARSECACRHRRLTKANIGKFEVISQELVGPVIGADLQRKGIYATLASIVGITIYIGLRFRFAFAIGAIAATLHDVL
jgi:preprotein translocase subunit SecF